MAVLLAATMVTGCDSAEGGPQDAGQVRLPKGSAAATSPRAFEYAAGRLLDFYPASPGAPGSPLAVLIPGVAPDPEPRRFSGFRDWGVALSGAGIAAAVIDYRADEEGSRPGQRDIATALSWLRGHARQLRIDAGRTALFGFSGGGAHLVKAAADDDNQPIAAIVAFYATIEPPSPSSPASLTALMRARTHLPVLVAWGAHDSTPEVVRARARFDRRASLVDVTTLVHPSAGHAFDAFTNDQFTQRIVDQTIDFLRHNLEADGQSARASPTP